MTMSDEKFREKLAVRRAATVEAEKVVPFHPALAEEALLPGEHAEYVAASVPANKGLVRLCCILGRGEFKPGGKPYRFFQYVHLDSHADFGYEAHGQVMTMRFCGMEPVTIAVHGRNLLQLCDYLQL